MIAFWTRRLSGLWLLLFWMSPALATPEVNIKSYQTEGESVKLKVNALEDREPVANLKEKNFEIFVDRNKVPINNFTPYTEKGYTPTRLVILLDMSDSMDEVDSSNKSKIAGAIQAIQAIINEFQDTPIKINLVPFGEGGGACRRRDFVPEPVEFYLKKDNFISPTDSKLRSRLTNFKIAKLCASTDLYNPLIATINYLEAEEKKINNQDNQTGIFRISSQQPTQFGIILLSDGFHSSPRRICGRDYEPKLFQKLKETIVEARKITIHTLGYGRTPKELGRNWGLSRPAEVKDVICSGEKQKRERERQFVDRERLEQIAFLGRGTHQFSGNATEVSQDLSKSVRAILGEYELEYLQPNGQPGQTNKAVVVLKPGSIRSKPENIRLNSWGFYKLSPEQFLFGSALAIGGLIGGIFVFANWSNELKRDS